MATPDGTITNQNDNNTQQGAPLDRWLARSNAIMGISAEVYVYDTIRDIQQFNNDQIKQAPTSWEERETILRGEKRAILERADGWICRPERVDQRDLFERGFIYQRDPGEGPSSTNR